MGRHSQRRNQSSKGGIHNIYRGGWTRQPADLLYNRNPIGRILRVHEKRSSGFFQPLRWQTVYRNQTESSEPGSPRILPALHVGQRGLLRDGYKLAATAPPERPSS